MGRSGCCTGFLCLGSLKRGKRIVPASRIHDGSNASPRPWGNNGGAAQPGGASNLYATLSPSLLAPPSSPASFQNSAVQSSAQSPCAFPVMSSNPAATSQIPLESAQTMFQMGPYAHETALVSPPVFSTFTTAPSTAPFTPPPELATHLTTPSSPDVPFAQLLANSFGSKAAARSQHPPPAFPASPFISPDIFSADDLQAAYQLYPGSPLAHLISPASGTGASTPFPDSEMSTQLTFQELENSQHSPLPTAAVASSIFIPGSPMTATARSNAASPISRSMGVEVELVRATPSQPSSGALTPVQESAVTPSQTDSRSETLAFSLQIHTYPPTLDLGASQAFKPDFAIEKQQQQQELQPGGNVEDQHDHQEKSSFVADTDVHPFERGQSISGWKAAAGHTSVGHGQELQTAGVKTKSSSGRLDDGRQQLQRHANVESFCVMNDEDNGGNLLRDETSNNSEAAVADRSPKKGPALPMHVGLSGFVLSDGSSSVISTVQIQQQQEQGTAVGQVHSSDPNGVQQLHSSNNLAAQPLTPPAAASASSFSPRVENAVVLERGPEAEVLVKKDADLAAAPQQCNSNSSSSSNNSSTAAGALDFSISDLVAWEHLKGTKFPAKCSKLSISKVSMLETTSNSGSSSRAGSGSAVHSRSSSKDSVSTSAPSGGSSLPMTRLADGGAACSDNNIMRLQQVTVAATTSATAPTISSSSSGHFDAAPGPSPSLSRCPSSSQQFNFTTQKFESTGHICGEDCAGGRAKLENKCVLKVLLEHAMEKPAGAVVKDRVGIYREQQLNASLKWMQAGTAIHQRSMVDSGPRERADLGVTCAGSHSGSSTPPLGISLVEELK